MANGFIDKARITVRAGNGGNGAVAFHREKYVAAGGPDGGDGGDGGSIIVQVDDNMSTLMDFRYKRKYVASPGVDGQGGRKSGKDGESLTIRVPRGTLIRDAETGEIINIDGTGNRVAALIYGPEHVIVMAGMNKVAANVDEALSRVHGTATPMNCKRLGKNTPCSATGVCSDCLSPDCICNQVVITRRSGIEGRIKVILIGEELGY